VTIPLLATQLHVRFRAKKSHLAGGKSLNPQISAAGLLYVWNMDAWGIQWLMAGVHYLCRKTRLIQWVSLAD
jgi:hypothetical protein